MVRLRGLSSLVVLALGFSAIIPLAVPVSAGVSGISIYMPGEDARFTSANVPVLVAGVIHSIDVSLDAASSNVTIVCHSGGTAPSVQNDTNYYSWAYRGTTFSDVKYGMYLNVSQCSVSVGTNTYKFAVGMSARAVAGPWNFTILVNGAVDWSGDVAVQSPDAGFSLSRPDFYFTVSPFQTQSVSSYNPSNQSFYVRSNNMGNVPLKLEYRFEPLGQYFTITNDSEIFHIGEQRYHYIGFNAPEWSPREFNVTGTVRGEPQYLITPATVALVPAFEQEFSITVRVQRTGYILLDFGKVIVQYVKNVPLLKYGNSTTIDAYFTGEGSVNLHLDGDRISITSATVDDAPVDPGNIVMSLSNTTERHLRVTVKATEKSNTAFTARVIYNLSWSEGGVARDETFATTVTVDRVPAGYEDPVDVNWIAIIAIIAVVASLVGFMVYYSNVKKREREQLRREKKKGRGKRG